MKFAGAFAISIAACIPLAIACGSAESPNFFPDRGGSRDVGAGSENANAGLSEGGAASEHGGTGAGGTLDGDGGLSSTGSAGKTASAGRGGSSSGGSSSAGTSSTAAAGGASAGSAGKANTSAGSGGTAGTSVGTGGNAGVNAGSGGSGTGGASGANGSSGSSGWNGWGGWTGWGGWSGWSGSSSGGSAGASSCPTNAPIKNDVCDVSTPDSCFYAGLACSCLTAPSGPGPGPINPTKKWACYGDGVSCPDTKPVAGTSCKGDAGTECPYPDSDYCVCSGTSIEAHWVCQANPPVCPATKPLDDLCVTVKTCSWSSNPDKACFCNGSRWGCEGGF